MTTIFLNLSLAILLPLLTGFLIIRLIDHKKILPIYIHFSLGYGIGIGLVSFILFTIPLFNLSFSKLLFIIIFSILISILTGLNILNSKSKHQNPSYLKNNEKLSPLHVFLIISILIFVLILFISTISTPFNRWDTLATIAFKAKVFYFERTIPHLNKLPHASYPLLLPLNLTWFNIFIGEWNDFLPKMIMPFTLISFLFIFYYMQRIIVSRTTALIGIILLMSPHTLQIFSTICYRDFILMYFNCTTIFLLFLWKRHQYTPFLILSSLFAACASFTKLEGSAFFIIYLTYFFYIQLTIFKPSIKSFFKNTILFFCCSMPALIGFHFFKFIHHVTEGSQKTSLQFSYQQLCATPKILHHYINDLIDYQSWCFFWIIFAISLLFWIQLQKKIGQDLIILVFLFFLLYMSVAIGTTKNIAFIETLEYGIYSRLTLHFFPIACLFVIYTFHQSSIENNQKKTIH